jgi:predicted ATPase
MTIGGFSKRIKDHLRDSGHSQNELANALNLHPKVLSRKLNATGNAHLTHLEIRPIITTLAKWHALTTRDEVLHLLEEVEMGPSFFSEEEWNTPPLSTLASTREAPATADPRPLLHTRQHNLPAPTTRLIGRSWATQRLQLLIQREDVRLVTLVGAGGCGKTRLALSLASKLIDTFRNGVWFVSLAGVNDPALVPVSILQSLDIQSPSTSQPLQSLIAYLQNKHLLLILDNVEQVREATGAVDAMLAASPNLKVLLTSRIALRMYGEHEFSVPPLDIPDPQISQVATELARYGAVQLFVERAQAVQPDFTLTDTNATTVAQICTRVDGLPLALELAAARIKILSPAFLLERLFQARLPVLTGGARNLPGRQQTLLNTIVWSYNLLSAPEQTWFCRLGIFTGGWSLEAAETMMEEITADQEALSASPIEMLEQLVSHSLIIQPPGNEKQVRFSMLETLREYALQQLGQQGSLEYLRDWHACYYLREAELAEQGLRGPQQLTWLDRLTADRDNFRAALEWSGQKARNGMRIQAHFRKASSAKSYNIAGSRILSTTGGHRSGLLAHELNLRLITALRPYWEWRGYLTEARYWLESALKIPVGEDAEETMLAAQAKALSEASRLSSLENNQSRAEELVEESIALWQRLNDPHGLAVALLHRAWVAHAIGEYERARKACQEGLDFFTLNDDAWLYAQLLFYLGAAAGFTGDFEQMRSLYGQSKDLFEQIGDTSAVADVLKDHGAMMILEGKYTESINLLLKSLLLCYQLDHRQYIMTGLGWLSISVGLKAEPDAAQASTYAAQIKGAAEALMETAGFTSWSKTNALVQAVEQYIQSQVDEKSWKAALNTGRTFTQEQLIDFISRLGTDQP